MRYIALLRAINVGGNRIVKMEDLRRILTGMGLTGVRSYIQSGNLVFDAAESDAEALARRIEEQLLDAVGFEIPTTLRRPQEWAELVQQLPEAGEDRLYVHFSGGAHHAEAAQRLEALHQEGLSLQLRQRELVLLMRKDLQDKRLASGNWLEKQLGTWLTARNANTVRKLQQMLLD